MRSRASFDGNRFRMRILLLTEMMGDPLLMTLGKENPMPVKVEMKKR